MKNKKIFLILPILFLLSGCSNNDPEPVSGNNSEPESSVITVSESSRTFTVSAPQTSEPEVIQNGTEMILSYDPKNFIKAVFDENNITVSGKNRGENCFINVYFKVDEPRNIKNRGYFDIDLTDDNFTAKYDCSELPGGDHLININLIDDNKWTYYELPVQISAEKITPSDNSQTVKNNSDRAAAAVTLYKYITAEYIVPGGESKEIERVLNEIKNLSDEICSGITDDYEKLRAISRRVSENIYYDLDELAPGGSSNEILSLDHVLKYKRSLCGGFSNITSALCAAQGIECYNVQGIKINSKTTEPHQCNFAVIDNRRIWVDTLWNSYNGHLNGKYTKGGQADTKYFDISDELFAYEFKVTICEFRKYF